MSHRILTQGSLIGTGNLLSSIIDLRHVPNKDIGINVAGGIGGGTPTLLCGDGTIMEPLKVVNPADGSYSTVLFGTKYGLYSLPCDFFQLSLVGATSATATFILYITPRK